MMLNRFHWSLRSKRALGIGLVGLALGLAGLALISIYQYTSRPIRASEYLLLTSNEYNWPEDHIFAVLPDGSQLTRLGKGLNPSCSPDGRRIAFAAPVGTFLPDGRDPYTQIFIMDADGSNVKQLTFSNGYNDSPTWAPDGRRLAFSADGGIAIMDLDNLRATDLMGPARWATYAAWSPDGQRLVFYAFSVSQNEGGLYVESVDGNDVTRLTNGHDVQPDWSPDGHHIVFLHGETVFSNPTLRVIEANGSNPVDILPEEPLRRSPKWSPDGRQVIFGRHYLVDVSKAEQAWRDAVFMVNADGSGLRLVIQPSGDVWGWERGALLPMPRGVMYGKVDWCKVR